MKSLLNCRNPTWRGTLACVAVAAGCVALGASDVPDNAAEPISLDFQDVEIRTALQLIADFAGFNLVAGDHTTGQVTLRLVDVPWDEALELVLATREALFKSTLA